MSAHAFRRVVAQSTRRSVQRSYLNSRLYLRRGMASEAGPEKTSNDTPWLIGAATVTAIGAAYILSPSSKKHAHDAAKSAKKPVEQALPKSEKEPPQPELVKDDEGTVADVSDSAKRSFESDNPKDAKASEEAGARFDSGAPGQTDDPGKPEVKEKPGESRRAGTLQNEPGGPTNQGDARQQAKGKNAPKNVAEKTDS